jgi:hypothetical protein
MTAMQRAAVLVAAILATGCAGASGLTIANRVGLGVQTAALACDWGQTRSYAADGWSLGHTEGNPIITAMGSNQPSTAVVDAYFLAMVGLSALGWYVLPPRYKLVVPIVITAIQADAVVHNLTRKVGATSVCGF